MKVELKKAYPQDDKDQLIKDITEFIEENWKRLNRGAPFYSKVLATLELDQ